MRVCLIGKFPPIQGGVSARMYRLAHGLARRGHAVHVVTNALEVEDSYRAAMRDEDNARLAGHYGDGYVRVHQTVSDPRGQMHVPWHNPYATKLAGLAIDVIRDHQLECVFSWYLEPYGVAGHLAAGATGTPHVMKTAGSDSGRLWHQPGMRSLYDHLFLSAEVIVAGGSLRTALAELGVRPERIVPGDSLFVPLDEFSPEGEILTLGDQARAGVATVGLFGKLGRFKGMRSLLRAIRTCLDRGMRVQLAAMVQGRPDEERGFTELLGELALQEHVARVPFLPHWRVPAFLRACDVVCCLEQDFPIKAHTPVIAQEILASGRQAMMSLEIAAKQPEAHRLAHGYNCWVVRDSSDPDEIARWLRQALGDPTSAAIGARGRRLAEHVQAQGRFPEASEAALRQAVEGASRTKGRRRVPATRVPGRYGLLELLDLVRGEVTREAKRRRVRLPLAPVPGADWFRAAGDALASARPAPAAEQGIRLALQLFETRRDEAAPRGDGLFRLQAEGPWQANALADHRPSLAPGATARTYPFSPLDALVGAGADLDGAGVVVVVLPFSGLESVKLYVLSGPAAELVMASDGGRTLAQVGQRVRWEEGDPQRRTLELAEELFALGVLALAAPPVPAAAAVGEAR